MSDLVRDYLALPDVAFAREHWLAYVVLLFILAGALWLRRQRRR